MNKIFLGYLAGVVACGLLALLYYWRVQGMDFEAVQRELGLVRNGAAPPEPAPEE